LNAVVAQDSLVSPLPAEKDVQLRRLLEGLAPHELYWIAARSAALAAGGTAAPAKVSAPAERVTVLYGSQTGNARRVAERLAKRIEAAGLAVRLVRADAYAPKEWAQERYLTVVISTQGEGEPPDDARGLLEFIAGRRAPRLPALRYGVLALGDSSYPQFCAIGRQLDARLAELGATRLQPLAEADVDVDAVAAPWLDATLERVREVLKAPAPAARAPLLQAVPAASHAEYDRDRPFPAPVLANQRIVSRHSEREVLHLELSLEGSGLAYRPGDALGVWHRNPAPLVRQWLDVLKLDGEDEVKHGDRSLPLARWLAEERELTRLARGFVQAHAEAGGSAALARVLRDDPAAVAVLLDTHQPIDLLRRFPGRWEPAALVAALRPLTPRLYSIASSQAAVGEEVHLTVSKVDYEAFGERHGGAASSFLADSAEDARVPVFVEPNERFRLPPDDARDVIMIGPGTGVAPFRAFVQERRETGARGRNWLFFGNRRFADDFLYQVEWLEALRQGALHRLDLAFSRDGADKVYVQHRLRERGRELYAWLRGGAHLYVCGDAKHMAKDVHAALVDVAVEHGGLSAEDAAAWLADLLQQGRYARDVY
jgi:sulfite reductase (NADPH) flavoprotein alpha-component